MRANEFLKINLNEGGWETTITQGTVINPSVVKLVLQQVSNFVKDYNIWAVQNKVPKIKMGTPLGSSSYYMIDPEDKVYGDVDLQMIAEPVTGTPSQFSSYYNKLIDQYIQTQKPKNIHYEKPTNGHVIFKLDDKTYVQVDLIWTTPELADWMKYRMTPERNVKGLIHGNLYSSLGEILGLAIQHSGVQMKFKDGKPISYQRGRKEDRIDTITTNIGRFAYDLLVELYKQIYGKEDPKVSKRLQDHPGLNIKDIKMIDLIQAIKGIAESFELNKMYGKGILSTFKDKNDFLQKFLNHYENKAIAAAEASKFEKATTKDAQLRAKETKDKIYKGLETVKNMFAQK